MAEYDLRLLFRKYDELIKNQEYDKISDDLDNTDIKNASVLEFIGKLRFTFCRWYKIKSWIPFRDKVKEELDSRNSDTKRIMYGLFDLKEKEKDDLQKTFERNILGYTD